MTYRTDFPLSLFAITILLYIYIYIERKSDFTPRLDRDFEKHSEMSVFEVFRIEIFGMPWSTCRGVGGWPFCVKAGLKYSRDQDELLVDTRPSRVKSGLF